LYGIQDVTVIYLFLLGIQYTFVFTPIIISSIYLWYERRAPQKSEVSAIYKDEADFMTYDCVGREV